MQRNSYWPLNGPSFSPYLDSIVVFFLAARKAASASGQISRRGMASRRPDFLKRRTSIRMTAARTTVILILPANAGSGDQRGLCMLLIRLARSCTLSLHFAWCSAGFGPYSDPSVFAKHSRYREVACLRRSCAVHLSILFMRARSNLSGSNDLFPRLSNHCFSFKCCS